MGGTDDPSNLVNVTIEEHANLHKQLWEELGHEEDRIAWMGLKGLITSGEAAQLAILLGAKTAGKIHTRKFKNDSSYREKVLNTWQKKGSKASIAKYPNGTKGFLGKKHTEEWKQNQSIIMKEIQKGSRNSQYGTCWITNGQEDKKIKKEELDLWLELGYTKGRKVNCNQHR